MRTSVKVALFVVFFIAVGGILAALYLYNLKARDLQKVSPDFVISAPDLQKAFEADEKAASAMYINKVVEVTGELIGSEGRADKSWNVTLQTGSDLSKVICTLPSVADPGVFVLGKAITIRGECSGFLSDVLLNNCVVVNTLK